MIFSRIDELNRAIKGILKIEGDNVQVLDESNLRGSLIDHLVYSAVLSGEDGVKQAARWIIRRAGVTLGVLPSSIQSLYDAMGRGDVKGFTVPAINIRGFTYETAQAVFRAGLRGSVGPIIFEIARSEIGYTEQRASEYACAITAAAIKTGWRGPLFLQGDHFQIGAKKFASGPQKEVDSVKDLAREAVEAGFYNIDIDSSTVVDLGRPTEEEQQQNNFIIAADITAFIRRIQPSGVEISVGGEIGEVGSKNSTVRELRAFMGGYAKELEKGVRASRGLARSAYRREPPTAGFPCLMEASLR